MIQLTQMSELVRKGIVQAAEDLQRENEDAVWQEGVLRHVPIVGSLYNWINPLQKVTGLMCKNDRKFAAKIEIFYTNID